MQQLQSVFGCSFASQSWHGCSDSKLYSSPHFSAWLTTMLLLHFQFILSTSRSMPLAPTLELCSKCGQRNFTFHRKRYDKAPVVWLSQTAYWKATSHPLYTTMANNPHIITTPQGKSSKVLTLYYLWNLRKSIFCAAASSPPSPKSANISLAVAQPVQRSSYEKHSSVIGILVVWRCNYRPTPQAYRTNVAPYR